MRMKQLRELYYATDAGGRKMGTRSLSQMSNAELYKTASSLVKYTNKQHRMLLDKGLVTDAGIAYARRSGKVNIGSLVKERVSKMLGIDERNYRTKWGKTRAQQKNIKDYRKALRGATHTVKKGMSDADYRGLIADSMGFLEAKTHTVKGFKEVQSKRMSAMSEKYGVDMSRMPDWQVQTFFDRLNTLAESNPQLATRINLKSPEVLKEIFDNVPVDDLNFDDLMEKMEEVAARYGDLSEEGLANRDMSAAFDTPRPSRGFQYIPRE